MSAIMPIEEMALSVLHQLWPLIAGDLPHPLKVMRQWRLDIDDWRTVARLRLIAGQQASRASAVRAVEAMRNAQMTIVETSSGPHGELVHATFHGVRISMFWHTGMFFLIADAGPAPALWTGGPAEDFVPYIEAEKAVGAWRHIHDSETTAQRVTELARQYRKQDNILWKYQTDLRTELERDLEILRLRFEEAEICRRSLFSLLTFPGLLMIIAGITSIFRPIMTPIGGVCVVLSVLCIVLCMSVRNAGFLLGWTGRTIISWQVPIAIFGIVALIWKQQELLAYVCIMVGAAVIAGSIYHNRSLSRALENGVSADRLLTQAASRMDHLRDYYRIIMNTA